MRAWSCPGWVNTLCTAGEGHDTVGGSESTAVNVTSTKVPYEPSLPLRWYLTMRWWAIGMRMTLDGVSAVMLPARVTSVHVSCDWWCGTTEQQCPAEQCARKELDRDARDRNAWGSRVTADTRAEVDARTGTEHACSLSQHCAEVTCTHADSMLHGFD